MNILLTNDDGIHAPGIIKLAEFLKEKYNVTVVAPDRERSAVGHAITLHKPLRLINIKRNDGLLAYAVNGTPSDCVKLAIDVVYKNKKPGLVISGINYGLNLGTDILYSGTVSAAIEAAIYDIPSIAVSLAEDANINDKRIYQFLDQLIMNIVHYGIPKNTLLNVNIPALKQEIKGIKITTLGTRLYIENFTKNIDPRGKEYYWMAGKLSEDENDERTDIVSVKNGFISITPIHFDLTRYDLIDALKSWDIKLK